MLVGGFICKIALVISGSALTLSTYDMAKEF